MTAVCLQVGPTFVNMVNMAHMQSIFSHNLTEIWGQTYFELHCNQMKAVLEKANKSAGLVWDPKKGCEIAVATEVDSVQPLRHCVMNLIDCVAHAQGSGQRDQMCRFFAKFWPFLAIF